MKCELCHEIISAAVDDACSQLEARAARRHVASCAPCRRWVLQLVALHDLLVEVDLERTPPELARRRLARVVHPATGVTIPRARERTSRVGATVIPLRVTSSA